MHPIWPTGTQNCATSSVLIPFAFMFGVFWLLLSLRGLQRILDHKISQVFNLGKWSRETKGEVKTFPTHVLCMIDLTNFFHLESRQLRDVEKCLQRWAITCKNSCLTPKRNEQTSIFDVYPLLLLVVQNFFWYSDIPFFDVLWWRHRETSSHGYRWTPNIPGPSPERIPDPLSSQRHQPARGRRCNMQMGWRIRLPVPKTRWMNAWIVGFNELRTKV